MIVTEGPGAAGGEVREERGWRLREGPPGVLHTKLGREGGGQTPPVLPDRSPGEL